MEPNTTDISADAVEAKAAVLDVPDNIPSVTLTQKAARHTAAMLLALKSRNTDLELRKDQAYEERNRVVALLAHLLPAVRFKTNIPGWNHEWHGCVYITLPNGQQLSWHYHDSQAHLFNHVPIGHVDYDGHSTDEKYSRIDQYIKASGGTNAVHRRYATQVHG